MKPSTEQPRPRRRPTNPASAAPPATIALQPHPVRTRVVRLAIAGHVVTSIYRDWRPGDSGPDGRCRLCERCTAHGDGCLIQISREVSAEEAPLVSRIGTVCQDRPRGIALARGSVTP